MAATPISVGFAHQLSDEVGHELRVVLLNEVVDAVFDAASDTFGVRLELPNTDCRLPAGIKCKIRFLEGAG